MRTDLGLCEWIPRISPRFEPPRHLSALVGALEQSIARAGGADTSTRQIISSLPPRHGKTETLIHGIAYGLAKNPAIVFGYVTYNDTLAVSKSRKAMTLAKRAGVKLATENISEWRTTAGGGMLAAGIMGTWTGHGVDIAIVDDPVKNRLEAESSTYRRRVWEQFGDSICTRVEPGGTVIVNMTRWHPDDLVGRLLSDEGEKWTTIRLPAINDRGEALWPSRWPLSLLGERRLRVGEYTWASLFQGEPRPREGALFGEPHTYEKLPTSGVLKSIGLDLAYSERTSSDWSVCAVMLMHDGLAYVVDVIRRQLKAPEFKMHIRAAWLANSKPAISWYAYGPEKGIGDFLRRDPDPLPVRIEQASGDHFVRAQSFSAAWNRGAVLVPESAPWLDDFLAEVCSFTGVSDDHDDQVDAVVAAWDYLAPHARMRGLEDVPDPGTPEWDRAQALEAKRRAAAGVQAKKNPFGIPSPNFGPSF